MEKNFYFKELEKLDYQHNNVHSHIKFGGEENL